MYRAIAILVSPDIIFNVMVHTFMLLHIVSLQCGRVCISMCANVIQVNPGAVLKSPMLIKSAQLQNDPARSLAHHLTFHFSMTSYFSMTSHFQNVESGQSAFNRRPHTSPSHVAEGGCRNIFVCLACHRFLLRRPELECKCIGAQGEETSCCYFARNFLPSA